MAGRPVRLTVTGYELLRVISLNAGRVSTYDKLRRKLDDDAARPTYIVTERRVGYRMAGPSSL